MLTVKKDTRKRLEIQMSHLLLYLKSCVNYIHCKIFNMPVSSVFNASVCEFDKEDKA